MRPDSEKHVVVELPFSRGLLIMNRRSHTCRRHLCVAHAELHVLRMLHGVYLTPTKGGKMQHMPRPHLRLRNCQHMHQIHPQSCRRAKHKPTAAKQSTLLCATEEEEGERLAYSRRCTTSRRRPRLPARAAQHQPHQPAWAAQHKPPTAACGHA